MKNFIVKTFSWIYDTNIGRYRHMATIMWIYNIKKKLSYCTVNTGLIWSFIHSTNIYLSTHYTARNTLGTSDRTYKKRSQSSWSFKKGGRQRSKQLKVDEDKALYIQRAHKLESITMQSELQWPCRQSAMRR